MLMAFLDNLPSDQRAVLELVLRRGRSYDDIARLLSIDRAAVRQRALAALDAIGPETGVPPERRALITDYLLGQLPARVSEDLRERLAESGSERAWARVIASELAPLASNPLPEIPGESARREPVQAVGERPAPPSPTARPSETAGGEQPRQPPPPARRSSRRGGAVLLGVAGAALIAAIVVVIVLVTGGSSSKHRSSTSRSGTSAASSTTATPIAQINLASPSRGKATGVAFVVRQGSTTGILIRASNIAPNGKHDAYAVWLYNSPTDAHILGFVNPGVGKNGQLTTAGGLPSNASHFRQVIVTLETTGNPRTPGQIVLEGTLTGV